MSPALAALIAIFTYSVGYRIYSRFLAEKLFELDETAVTPAHELRDGIDYVPTKPAVLFGHHFASITGLAPMLGPAIAVIWGWAPAMIWVVIGSLLIGCVHDFSALIISARHRGQSVGMISERYLSARAKTLFLLIIFFGVSLAMGVFVFVISKLFGIYLSPPSDAHAGVEGYPQAVFPSLWLMIIAAVSGWLMEKRGVSMNPIIVVGFILSLIGIWVGLAMKRAGVYDPSWWPSGSEWMIGLLMYAFAASVLPVWSLLQPRDFLNSLLLYLGLGLAYLGLFVGQPSFDAPALVMEPVGAPPMLPFVFILIACGAASGFHGLVSSGTTAKQLDLETHARPIGYGGMIGESLLGLLAVLACTAGFQSPERWHEHYASFHTARGLSQKLGGFIEGTTHFLTSLGIPAELASALIAMVVVSFALTTLDSATRLLRFNIEELVAPLGNQWLSNRYVSSALACLTIATFAFYKIGGKPAALALWALFGTTNQLLAGLTLTLVTLYLRRRGKSIWYTALPAVFMLSSTFISMGLNLSSYLSADRPDWLLISVGLTLLVLGLWIIIEAVIAFLRPMTSHQDPTQDA